MMMLKETFVHGFAVEQLDNTVFQLELFLAAQRFEHFVEFSDEAQDLFMFAGEELHGAAGNIRRARAVSRDQQFLLVFNVQ